MKIGTCRSCPAPVIWAVNEKTGKVAPLNVDPDPRGPIVIVREEHQGGVSRVIYRTLLKKEREDLDRLQSAGLCAETRYTNHYQTCPQAKDWAAKQKGRR